MILHPKSGAAAFIDVLKVLIHFYGELSLEDAEEILRYYFGPPDALEWLISRFPRIGKLCIAEDGLPAYPVLATALRAYGLGKVFPHLNPEWESFIRKVIRDRPNLHTPVPVQPDKLSIYDPCEASGYGTPLDELFWGTMTPCDSRLVSDSWLRILASEGYDIDKYLRQEIALRDKDLKLTFSSFPSWSGGSSLESPRHLIFDLEGDPCVSWDWWVDPLSPIALLSEELKSIVRAPDDAAFEDLAPLWICSWPITYTTIYQNAFQKRRAHYRQLRQFELQIEQDDARRLKKREKKSARKTSNKNRCRMPGSW